MYCPKCGTNNNESAQFCVSCGRSLNEFQAANQTQAPSQPQMSNQSQTPNMSQESNQYQASGMSQESNQYQASGMSQAPNQYQESSQSQAQNQYQTQNQSQGMTSEEADIQNNKAVAIIAYFIFFIPLLAAKDSPFARYHANQGLTLLIFSVGFGIISTVVSTILAAVFLYSSLVILGIVNLVFGALYVGLVVVAIMGIVNAAQGKMQPMPVIGSLFKIIK